MLSLLSLVFEESISSVFEGGGRDVMTVSMFEIARAQGMPLRVRPPAPAPHALTAVCALARQISADRWTSPPSPSSSRPQAAAAKVR